MAILFLTGLSGVGKSSALSEMTNRGYHAIDLDDGYMMQQSQERLIDAEKILDLIENHQGNHLILAGTESNQGEFYVHFDAVVLLTAELETVLARIKNRTNNSYGKTETERNKIIDEHATVLPLLKKRADLIIDTTSLSIEEVCDALEALLTSFPEGD